jgi:transposase
MYQGSYVFSQVFDLVNRYDFDKCVRNHNGNYRIKTFNCWQQFIVMSFAQLSYRESLRDIEFCLVGMRSKLYHCGIKNKVARSTLAKANENRTWKIYADFAKVLINIAVPLHRGENDLAKELKTIVYAFDSTTIDLCLELFPWAKFRQTKSAIKVHVLLNLDGSIPEFVTVTEGKKQDVNLLDEITYISGCFYLMDKAYTDFRRLYKIELQKAFFVTRAKENLAYTVTVANRINKKEGVKKDELIKMKWHHGKRKYPIVFRRIEYYDAATKKELIFITNHLTIEAVTIARLYKERWKVELFFKWIKQNLKIKRFYGNSENAVKTQIWIAVCDYLLIAILRKQLKIEASLNQILQILSISLFEKCNIKELFIKEQTNLVSNQFSLFES